MNKKLLIGGAVVLALLVIGVVLSKVLPSSPKEASAGTLVWVEVVGPSVKAFSTDNISRELETGDEIKLGERVEVGQSGNANIYFPDGSVVRVQDGTNFVIDEALFNEKTQSIAVKVRLLVGKVWCKVLGLATQDSIWEVKTANAVATVRGTAFGVEHKDGKSSVLTTEHKVEVAPVDQKTGEILKAAAVEVTEQKFVELRDSDVNVLKQKLQVLGEVKKEVQQAAVSAVFAVRDVAKEKLQEDWVKRSLRADEKFNEKFSELRQKGKVIEEIRQEFKEEFKSVRKEALEKRAIIKKEFQKEARELLDKAEDLKQDLKDTKEEIREKLNEVRGEIKTELPAAPSDRVRDPELSGAPTSVAPLPTTVNPVSLAINSVTGLSNVQEGDQVEFRAMVLMTDGSRQDVTETAVWKVIGPIGSFSGKPGVFDARLDDAVSENGEASGAVTATWKNPISGTLFLGKSPIFKVSLRFEVDLNGDG